MLLLLACADPPPEDAVSIDLALEAGPTSFEARLQVSLSEPAPLWVTCTSPDDAEELHLLESPEASTHELALFGLLAGTTYDCAVHAGASEATGSFTTAIPDDLPQLTATTTGEISGAYTLFATQDGCLGGDIWILFVDPEGRVRWEHALGDDYIADIDPYLMDANRVHYGGGWGLLNDGLPNRGIFRDVTLAGEVLIERTEVDFGLGFNHHSEPLPDGTYVSLTGHLDTDGARDWKGVGVEVWDPEDGVVWSWDSQEMYDAGLLFTPSVGNEDIPYHANAITLRADAHGDAAWISNYGMQQIWRIDRASGDVTHIFGPGADFTLLDAQGSPISDAGYPSVQHGVDYADDRMLVYDNGQDVGRSRVVEYSLDLDTNEARLLWEWTEPGWFDPIVGDADYLPNGDVLVAQGFASCVTPFSNDVTEVVELAPPDDVVWRLTWPTSRWGLYRAERYDGCDVFANARYCPDVAARIAALRGT